MFVGLYFSGDSECFEELATDSNNLDELSLTNGIYDLLYGSNLGSLEETDTNLWGYDTEFFANFQNSLIAGNIDYTIDTVQKLIVKRKIVNTNDWLVLYEKDVSDKGDFSFNITDKYVKANEDYMYAVVPVNNGIEGNYNTATVHCNFDSYFILDKENVYPIALNVSNSSKRNKQSSTVITLGSKYPFVFYNGKANYETGSIKCTFIAHNNGTWDIQNGWKYRKQVDEFLLNGKPKIIKDFEGDMLMIDVTGSSISKEESQHYQMPYTSFEYTEIGDAENQEDLYNNGFIDVAVN